LLISLLQQGSFQTLTKLLEAWEVLSHLWDKIHYHGLYEILDYDATLEIIDPKGEKAVITRREVVRFLQDNVVAIHDHAWGDGQLFAEYSCQPGVAVDFYEDGSKYNVLISLRETKNRGDVVEFWIERVIKRGLLEDHEWFETEIDHWMKRLKLSIIFPKERPCRRATLSQRSSGRTMLLPQKHFALLPDGRQKLTWETSCPKLHDRYTIKWAW
jgi:hypothetical protein